MLKPILVVTTLTLTLAGWRPEPAEPVAELSEARLFIEFTPAEDEATLAFEAEAEEAIDRAEVRDPDGAIIFRMRTQLGQEGGLSSLALESEESSLATLVGTCREGLYDVRARTAGGTPMRGSALLSHELLRQPLVLHPLEGDSGIAVTSLIVSWVPDPKAAAYQVGLEQGESDGLMVSLPPGTSSLRVPDGFLAPGTATKLEVIAVAGNGNRTVAKVSFTTR